MHFPFLYWEYALADLLWRSNTENNSMSLHFFEDGEGQQAVNITIGLKGRYWRHILIYDKNNKRIKRIKYPTGYYSC